ncbi:hypothetical protein [Kitasatospora sp. NPDC059571]
MELTKLDEYQDEGAARLISFASNDRFDDADLVQAAESLAKVDGCADRAA